MTEDEIDRAFRELVEDEVLENASMIGATARHAMEPTVLPKRSQLISWSALGQVLAALAFDPHANDGWPLLGVPRDEGPTPNIEQLERRAGLAKLLASVRHTDGWAHEDKIAAECFEQHVEVARQRCIDELPKALRNRKRRKGVSVPT